MRGTIYPSLNFHRFLKYRILKFLIEYRGNSLDEEERKTEFT